MVEVFRTNIKKVAQSKMLVRLLSKHFPGCDINFDLDDCDKVLRVEGDDICPLKIIETVSSSGYLCEAL
jgi:hypothetical protein